MICAKEGCESHIVPNELFPDGMPSAESDWHQVGSTAWGLNAQVLQLDNMISNSC